MYMWCFRGEKKKECKQFEVHKNKVHDNPSVKKRCGDKNNEYKDCQRNFLANCKTDEVHIVNLNENHDSKKQGQHE